jgi:hypothetical protein
MVYQIEGYSVAKMGQLVRGEQTHVSLPSDNAAASHHFDLVPDLSHTLL